MIIASKFFVFSTLFLTWAVWVTISASEKCNKKLTTSRMICSIILATGICFYGGWLFDDWVDVKVEAATQRRAQILDSGCKCVGD